MRLLTEVPKACDNSVKLHVSSSVCVVMHLRKISSLAACILPALCEGMKSEEGLGTPDKSHGGRDAPGLLRSLHQASGQQRSVAPQCS